jgi:hypothetical protein
MRGESGSEHNGDIRSKLSDEARGRLDALAIDCLAAVREAFRDYARKIHATEWASYDDGETEQFIECFTPMARELVAAYLKEFTGISNDLSPWMARNVLNLIKGARTNSLIPPTYPWRPPELFQKPAFRDAMHSMITHEINPTNIEELRGVERAQALKGHVMEAGKLRRRNARYEAIDKQLRKIAEMRPMSHEEVFRSLDRRARTPYAEPFATARGWLPGFQRDPAAARAWLSKAWSRLHLPPFRRGPK